MLKKLLTVLFVVLLSASAHAQIHESYPWDSTTVRFNSTLPTDVIPDTASLPLWQLGHTSKPFFSTDTMGSYAIMTDTTHFYPANANNFFILKIAGGTAKIVDFWHRFQTNSCHAGGIVDFSTDDGLTWQNIKGDCNRDSTGFGEGVYTSGFYSFADTLYNGSPAFMGQSAATQYSRLQFFGGFPMRSTTSTSSCQFYTDSFYLRFSFVSDTAVDTLAGWMIDSIKIEQDFYTGGSVGDLDKYATLNVYPNPSFDGTFTFPTLLNEVDYAVDIYNSMGQKLLTVPYTHCVQLIQYPIGLYYYKVFSPYNYYSGRLLRE